MAVTYAAGALSLSLTSIDETNGPTDVAGGYSTAQVMLKQQSVQLM